MGFRDFVIRSYKEPEKRERLMRLFWYISMGMMAIGYAVILVILIMKR